MNSIKIVLMGILLFSMLFISCFKNTNEKEKQERRNDSIRISKEVELTKIKIKYLRDNAKNQALK